MMYLTHTKKKVLNNMRLCLFFTDSQKKVSKFMQSFDIIYSSNIEDKSIYEYRC